MLYLKLLARICFIMTPLICFGTFSPLSLLCDDSISINIISEMSFGPIVIHIRTFFNGIDVKEVVDISWDQKLLDRVDRMPGVDPSKQLEYAPYWVLALHEIVVDE